jgi:hypothetical protein
MLRFIITGSRQGKEREMNEVKINRTAKRRIANGPGPMAA